MSGVIGMHNIGRPKKADIDKVKFILKSFYFPFRLEDVWSEFERLTIEESSIKELGLIETQKNKCVRIILRRLILMFVVQHSKNTSLKIKIKDYLLGEDKYIDSLISSWKSRKKQVKEKGADKTENKEKFNLKTFYFPERLRDAYNEFVKLCNDKFSYLSQTQGRVTSFCIRNLVLAYVKERTNKAEIKAKIEYYLREEKVR